MAAAEIPEGTVTVLFTDLVDSTRLNQALGDDAARELTRRIEAAAHRQIEAHRGVPIKDIGDGTMAAFASARRAVTAAREIQADVRRLARDGVGGGVGPGDEVALRIGLHTGEVIAEDGDLHGETVIIAKRIEGLAPPGGILASQTVHGVLGTARDELVEQGPAELKGIDAEWTLYLVPVLDDEPAAGLADGDPTPYIGRVAERERLRSLLEAAAAGRGAMVLLGGPAGVGKSRLTREASAVARQLDMTVRTGTCLDMESPPPYQPSIDQLEETARRLDATEFRALLGENAPEIAKLMPSLHQRYDDIAEPPDLTPEQERRYMLHGVGEFLARAAAIKPLLLVFEDLHWADESTLLLLRQLGPRLPETPLLVLGTYRDDEVRPDRPLAAALGPLVRDLGAADLHLRLLDEPQVAALLAARAGQDPPPELVRLVFDETQGNPYFAEELYRHLRDEGRLFDEEGGWRAGFEIGDTEVPQGVRLVLGRRLDQLDPGHRRVLATAAVIGRWFSFDGLAAAAGADEDDLLDALEAAERLHLVEEAPSEHDARYAFVHEQVRQTLLGELSLARRQRLHLRVADALAARAAAVGDRAPVELAHHLVQAGSAAPPERTAAALVAAAEASLGALAFEDAARHLDHAEPLVASDATARRRIDELRVDALRGAGRVDDALAVLERRLRDDPGTDEALALRLRRVQLLNDQYRAGEGLDDLAVLVAAAEAGGDPELLVEVLLAKGRAHYILSLDRPDHAHDSRDAYEAAYEAAAARGDERRMALALLPSTWFVDYWADYGPTASANVDEALALAEAVGDEDLLLDALAAKNRQGGVRVDLAGADALLARLEARRDPVRLGAHCFWLMWQYLSVGRFDDCVATCDRGIELADLIGSAPVQYGSIKAIALVEMGRFDEVDGAIAQEVTDDDHRFGQAMAALAGSIRLTRLQAWRPAADSLTDTMARATDLSRVWMQAWAGQLMAVVAAQLRALGDGEAAAALLAAAGDHGAHAVGLHAGEIALVEGRVDAAVVAAERLIPAASEPLERDHVAALELLARARLADGDPTAALVAVDRALPAAEAMGFGALVWRLLAIRAEALAAGAGDGPGSAEQARAAARAAYSAVADRIADPDLRAWFDRQPLAATLLAGD
ncbi:MAG: AAA family ATPase [Acidimicrobiales bacterium]|nr:AAA family ATPase [Acidimicrobiales bacterium]